MNIYTKVDFLQRSAYFDVYILYTHTGKKYRAPTGVKVSPKHLTKTKTISTGHPGYHHDLMRIQVVQQNNGRVLCRDCNLKKSNN
jgi:hypothetical protein